MGMMMIKKGGVVGVVWGVMVVVVMVMAVMKRAEGVNCSIMELTSCASAITSGSSPSSTCCSKLREQKPCFCGYLKNPALGQYIHSPNARRVASTCGVQIPKC